MRPALQKLSCCLVLYALLWPQSASATTIDPLLFEELVLRADFVGIVECEQAGGIVATYRVIEPVPHRNLQKRVLVLLSNSARASGVPQPAPPGQPPSSFDSLLAWWKKHGDTLVLSDPWLGILEQQKVD